MARYEDDELRQLGNKVAAGADPSMSAHALPPAKSRKPSPTKTTTPMVPATGGLTEVAAGAQQTLSSELPPAKPKPVKGRAGETLAGTSKATTRSATGASLGIFAGGNDFVNERAARGRERKHLLGSADAIDHGLEARLYGTNGNAAASDLPPARIPGVSSAAAKRGSSSDLPPARQQTAPDAAENGPRMPVNNDPRAQDFLSTNARPTDGGLNVNNPQAVPGLEGVGYAGRYGQTDVFTGRGDQGQRSFSDLANLAAVRGGLPAAAPKGANVVSNDSLVALSPSTSEQLAVARQAAADRGDWDAVERSFMTAEQRAEADQQKELAKIRAAALKDNPAAVYEAELAAQNSGLSASDLYRMQRDATTDRRTSQRDAATRAKQAIDILKAGFDEFDEGAVPLREYEGIVGSIVQERPDLLPDQVAALARQQFANYESVMAP